MPNCYCCGRNILPTENTYKRELYSGHTNRTYYGKRISFGNSRHYSMKTVCAHCASNIDQQRTSQRKGILIFLLIVIVAILFFLAIK